MRVMTMNLFGHHRNWDDRRRVIVAGLRRIGPDVVTFQETVVRDGYDQVLEVLGPGYHVFHQPGRSDDGVGASIASRWPLDVLRAEPAGSDSGWIGGHAVVEISAPEPIGAVLLVHPTAAWESAGERAREFQAVAAARIVEELVGDGERHVVLAGDLNATPDAASIRFWAGRQSLEGLSVCYQDAWAATHGDELGATFTPENGIRSDRWRPRPPERIDYVMVRRGAHGSTLDIVGCELAFDRADDGVWASDHFGVVADFEPAPPSDDPT